MAKVLLWLVCGVVGLSSIAGAWESTPEFQSLTELEQGGFDRPEIFGPEYQADMLAFMRPFGWEYAWLGSDTAFDTSFGSISAVNFSIENRFKLRRRLNDWLEFRLTYTEERNHDRVGPGHLVPEFVFWPLEKWGVSLYGEPAYGKRENDVGVAVLFRPSLHHEIRAFNTLVDTTRQKRSDRTDTFVEGALPVARGIVGRWWNPDKKGDFFEYALRYETKTAWRFPDERYEYRYWKGMASLFGSREVNSTLRVNARAQVDRRFESRAGYDGLVAAVPVDAWTTSRALGLVQAELSGLVPQWRDFKLTLGMEYAYRRWSVPRDTLIYNDYLPHLVADVGAWRVLYDATIHDKVGGGAIGLPVDSAAVEQRVDISYGFRMLEDKAELRLMMGFDVDAFGTRDTWEAGCAQFRMSL